MPDWLREWWPLIGLVTPLAVGGVLWAVRTGLASKADLATESRARAAAIDELEKKFTDELRPIERRVSAVEHEVRHLPTADDLSELRNEVTRVGTLVEGSTRELQSVGRALTRVEDHLLQRAS